MYYRKECPYCGRIFLTKVKDKKFCNNACRSVAVSQQYRHKEQLCWACAKCTGGCSWSHNFTPIDGWTAKPVCKKDAGQEVRTYKITACPEFVRG